MEELNSLADLLDLQDVDSEIDRLLNRRSSLPELEAFRAAAAAADGLAASLAESEGRLHEVNRSIDKAEGELVLHTEKKEIEERRLYAGGLSARETDHLRQEVQMLTRQVGVEEDALLEMMEVKETEETRRSELAGQLEVARAEQQRIEVIVAGLWKEIDAHIGRKEARKATVVPLIPPDLLEIYEEIRPMKEGVAVARLTEGTCSGCHLRLSAAERADAGRESPPRCIHCRRILVPQ